MSVELHNHKLAQIERSTEDWRSLFNMESHPELHQEDFRLLSFHVAKLSTIHEINTWSDVLKLTVKYFPKLKEIELVTSENLTETRSENSHHKRATFASLKKFLYKQHGILFSWISTSGSITDEIEYELWNKLEEIQDSRL